MTGRNLVLALVCVSLIGCGSTRTLNGGPADWNSILETGDRVTVVGTSGQKVAIRFEAIEDDVLYGTLNNDARSAFAIPLDEIDKLQTENAAGAGQTLSIIGLVVLGVALIDALQNIPPGWPAYQ